MSKPSIASREAIAAVASGRAPLGTTRYIREACERAINRALAAERRRVRKAIRELRERYADIDDLSECLATMALDDVLAAVRPARRGGRR